MRLTMRATMRRRLEIACWAIVLLCAAGAVGAQAAPFERVIVLGFDGADPARTRRLMDAGRLPHLAALAERGTFAPLATTAPAQSPVSWSSMITGLNPGRTGVFGFLRLTESDGEPGLEGSMTRWVRRPLPLGSPGDRWFVILGTGLGLGILVFLVLGLFGLRRKASLVVGLFVGGVAGVGCFYVFGFLPAAVRGIEPVRDGEPFYARTAAAGLRSIALGAPMDCPPPRVPGLEIVCGLGVPDLAGTVGSWAVYSTERRVVPPDVAAETDGRIVLLDGDGPDYTTSIVGSRNPLVADVLDAADAAAADTLEAAAEKQRARAKLRERLDNALPLAFEWTRGQPVVTIKLPDASATVSVGEWTPYLSVAFRSNRLLVDRGVVRFYVARADDEMRVYQEPIGLDPRVPNRQVPIGYPPDLAPRLVRTTGVFDPTGWGCATNAFRDEVIDEATFLGDVAIGRKEREAMLDAMLARRDWRCLFTVFTGIDRVQHLLGRHLDPSHPAHVADEAAAGRAAIDEAYVAMDRIVGRVARAADARTALIVVSDHGFADYHTGVDLNAWLEREGYLVRRTGAAGGAFFPGVDWQRTRAFAFGLGQIYINRSDAPHGRGHVARSEVGALAAEIAGKLAGLTRRGKPVVRRVDTAADRYAGPRAVEGPDLLPGFEPGYRAARASIFGGRGERIFEENASRWSGDHCSVAPDAVPGILFASLPFDADRASVLDVAPTVLSLLGVSATGLDGRPLARR